MSKPQTVELTGALFGTITSISLGPMIFQGLGTIVLGMLGALGGYLFIKVIKPRLDKLFDKKKAE